MRTVKENMFLSLVLKSAASEKFEGTEKTELAKNL